MHGARTRDMLTSRAPVRAKNPSLTVKGTGLLPHPKSSLFDKLVSYFILTIIVSAPVQRIGFWVFHTWSGLRGLGLGLDNNRV